MKRKKRNPQGRNIRLAFVFFVLVGVFISISLVFRVGLLVANSKFDSANRFAVKVQNGKDIMILSFSPKSQSISVLDIRKVSSELNINKFLAIPIDASIGTTLDIKERQVPDLMRNFILNYGSLETSLTIIDMLRLYLFANTIPKHYIQQELISTSFSSSQVDRIVARFLKDESIETESVTIEIVNTTDAAGLGGRLARLISNMGGNVVIVKSSDQTQSRSTISYFGKKNYTAEKLERILGYATNQMTTKTIADIVIMLGMDSIDIDIF